jgi:hypothetical protein
MKVTFQPFISPGQAKYGDRARTSGTVGVAVESAVQKHISRLDIYSAPKAGFDKGTAKNHTRITVYVQMTRRCCATRKCFKSEAFRLVFEFRAHAYSLANCDLTLRLQKDSERQPVRDQQQRHNESRNEVSDAEPAGHEPGSIGLVERV